MDLFYGRGAMDHRLRVSEAIARLERFRVHDAPFWGAFRGAGLGHMGLMNNISWRRFPEFDLLLFTGIPYAAIGIENCYALSGYVKAGGAVLFTGGEWAFGKGGYLMTVLERELLPILCVEMDDCRTSERPIALLPGPDFGALQFPADFSASPSFWVYNRVLLKEDPAVKVFLTSEAGPILVGWTLGKGRVACLLADYRGKSEKGVTAFFDWADWPRLLAAVFRWLTPEAGQIALRLAALSPAETRVLTSQLTMDTLASVLEEQKRPGSERSTGTGERVRLLRRLLEAPADAVDPTIFLDHLLTPGELPADLRWRIVDAVLRNPPTQLADRVRTGRMHEDPEVRQNAIQLLGLVDGNLLLEEIQRPPARLEADPRGQFYALVLSLPLVRTAELVGEGRKRVAEWNAAEQTLFEQWTGGKGFSTAAPETPLLDADTLLERLGWLAYLSRHFPREYGAQFTREWLKVGVYQECGKRTIVNNREAGRGEGDWDRLIACFGRLGDLTRSHVEGLFETAPEALADGLCRARFTREMLAARNLLGDRPPATSVAVLKRVASNSLNRDLASFAAARAAHVEP